jgi:hypothetical protein
MTPTPLDPTTGAAELYALAQSDAGQRAAIAAHPNAYPDLLTWLGSLGDPEVDRALAERAQPAPAPARAAAAAAPRRRLTRRVKALLIGGLVLVCAIVAAVVFIPQIPHYPETSPLQRDDLDAMVDAVNGGGEPWQGTRYKRNENGMASYLAGTTPYECGTLRAFGNSAFTVDEWPTSEDYDVRTGIVGADWMTARLFVSTDAAAEYVQTVAALVGSCGSYGTPEGDDYVDMWVAEEWLMGAAVADAAFRERRVDSDSWSNFVLVQNENVVFMIDFHEVEAGTVKRVVASVREL